MDQHDAIDPLLDGRVGLIVFEGIGERVQEKTNHNMSNYRIWWVYGTWRGQNKGPRIPMKSGCSSNQHHNPRKGNHPSYGKSKHKSHPGILEQCSLGKGIDLFQSLMLLIFKLPQILKNQSILYEEITN